MFAKHKSYLSADFKSSVQESIHLSIVEKGIPVFCKARCVPVRACLDRNLIQFKHAASDLSMHHEGLYYV